MRHRNVYVALINLSFPAIVKSTIISQPKGPSKGDWLWMSSVLPLGSGVGYKGQRGKLGFAITKPSKGVGGHSGLRHLPANWHWVWLLRYTDSKASAKVQLSLNSYIHQSCDWHFHLAYSGASQIKWLLNHPFDLHPTLNPCYPGFQLLRATPSTLCSGQTPGFIVYPSFSLILPISLSSPLTCCFVIS